MNILKQQAAKAALDYIQDDIIVGVGSGSTVNYFIEELRTIQHRIAGCVASSVQSELRLQAAGIPVFDLNVVNSVPIYIDGADEVNSNFEMIKGGGGALTREKIIATVAECFICIVDETKVVANLGQFPIAVEVLPIARSFVARELLKLGGDPAYRQGFITDNQNIILDVSNIEIDNIIELEEKIKAIPGVVESGLFGKRKADCILIGHANGSTKKTLT